MKIRTEHQELNYSSRKKLEVIQILEKANVRALYQKIKEPANRISNQWIPNEIQLLPEEIKEIKRLLSFMETEHKYEVLRRVPR